MSNRGFGMFMLVMAIVLFVGAWFTRGVPQVYSQKHRNRLFIWTQAQDAVYAGVLALIAAIVFLARSCGD